MPLLTDSINLLFIIKQIEKAGTPYAVIYKHSLMDISFINFSELGGLHYLIYNYNNGIKERMGDR